MKKKYLWLLCLVVAMCAFSFINTGMIEKEVSHKARMEQEGEITGSSVFVTTEKTSSFTEDNDVKGTSQTDIPKTSTTMVSTVTSATETTSASETSVTSETTTIVTTTLPESSFYEEIQQTEPPAPPQTMPSYETEPPSREQPSDLPVPEETPPPQTEPVTEPSVSSPDHNVPSALEFQDQVLELVNKERANAGLSPLSFTDALNSAANIRAVEIYQSFGHTRPDGSSCFSIIGQFGIQAMTWGENIAAGMSTPQDAVRGWMESEGHRNNILNGSFTSMGVGYYKSEDAYGHYWVQIFTG